ncbi:saccharopine dehydrogenase [Epidermidibacterium keratini]|uniref:Saccharopine dehydrogenase n=1 Tax=Epidermidibacterium keratini TaxID=1891644 RepID=A0A7L4YLT5_9ACTN|nr:saccharopine dehydrogenase NADP-binding domain-containing protein [Epidermidibacterium keratini]QHC00231.1 saccharopine dehydrogenase [Epidermidibacterium keratini]
MSKIVLLGATGYTGELTAHALRRQGSTPLLAARREDALQELAASVGGDFPTAVADISDPASVRALLDPGDVLITTVGPFARWGEVAVEAAIDAGAHYLDSTGEASFIRDIFLKFGPRAEQAGVTLLTAMGYDWVPGNLAGAVAIERGGDEVSGVLVGYFNGGKTTSQSMSGGTFASSAGAMFYPSHSHSGGQFVTERNASRVHDFGEVEDGVPARAFSVGSSESLSLPRVYQELQTVDVYLGWNDPDKVQAQAAALEPVLADEGARAKMMAEAEANMPGSTGGPDAELRAQSYAVILAEGIDAAGDVRSKVRAQGANGYDFTADFLALAGRAVLDGEVTKRGAIGPVEAFGVPRLTELVAQAGITLD